MINEFFKRIYDCLSLREFGNNKSRSHMLKELMIREKNRMHKGIGETNAIRYPIQFVFILAIFAKQYLIGWSMAFYITLGILGVFALWLVGFVWDVFRLYHVENEFSNRRNKFVKEMRTWRKNQAKKESVEVRR
jgi:hypothetical protein